MATSRANATHRCAVSRTWTWSWRAAFLALLLANKVSAQSKTSTSLTVPYYSGVSQCSSSQIFDTSNLNCTSCPTGFIPTNNHLACQQCDPSSGALYDTVAGYGTSMKWVGSSSTAMGSPPLSCACPTVNGSASVSVTVYDAGTYRRRCVICPTGYTAGQTSNGQPACIPPVEPTATFLSESDMFANVTRALGYSISYVIATTASFPASLVGNTPPVANSYPLSTYLGPGAYDCYYGANRDACNAVANMCALQLYSIAAPACVLYSRLLPANTNPSAARPPSTGALPWLYYGGNTYLSATDVGLNFVMHGGAINSAAAADDAQTISVLTFVLSAYAMNGTWLGYHNWTKQFQICGTDKQEAGNWLNFGWDYSNSCQLSLNDILLELPDGSTETTLYDPYIQTGSSSLYPIPVKITNYVPNPTNDVNQGAVRRFFYVDGAMGRAVTSGTGVGPVQVLQYPVSMQLVFTLQSDPRNQIFPPQLFITYNARAVGVQTDLTQAATFSATYTNNGALNSRFWYAWQMTLIVIMCVLAFPVLVWKAWLLTRRRRGSENADTDFLFAIIIALCDIGSAGLTAVLFFVSVYYLVLYKLQNSVYYMMISDGDLGNFTICVYLAIVGQTVGLINLVWEQSKVDVFFLDWEKGRKVLSKEGTKEEAAPVNCWRMILLANEYSELQTQRWSSTPLTLLLMSLILGGNSVIASADITPFAGFFVVFSNNVSSIMLRWGIEASFFAVLYLGQLLFIRFAYFRWVSNPISNFIDLAFLCNISVILFDERHSGYYIHGRNQAQHSDTDLKELNQALLREEEGLVGERGLVVNNQGNNAERLNQNQVFNVFITDDIRKTYESKMLRQVAQSVENARMRKGYVSTLLNGHGNTSRSNMSAQQDIASTFKRMLDDVERNSATRVIDPTYFQMVTQLPPLAAADGTVFVHDYFNSFTSTLFLGNDLRLYVYEALFFCTIDCLALNNVTMSALITYAVHLAFAWVRQRLGENNLSTKTLVDQHFLI